MSDDTAPAPKRIEVKRFVEAKQLKADLTYSIANLSGAMVEQAAMFSHYATLAAQASRQVDEIDLRLEVVSAQISRELRDEAAKTGTKTTVEGIKNDVLTSARIIALRKALNEAKQIESECKTATEAFRHRRDMLVQLGAHEREEMKGELRTKAIGELERRAVQINRGEIG